MIDNFLTDCLVVDTETTGLDITTSEICELGTCVYDGEKYLKSGRLFGTKEPIGFSASAKNNIS